MQVKLRAIEPEDLDFLYLIENNMEIWNVGITNVPYSKYALNNYISNASYDIYKDEQVRLIIENDDSKIVGIADIFNFSPQHNRAEVGIIIVNEFRGLGYANKALNQLINYSKNILHLHQLYAIIDEANIESNRLFKSVGFKETAYLKDWMYNGMFYSSAHIMQFFL